jgi:hypothetical protein
MAISATYITLQRQIADELGGRTDLLSVLSGSSLTLTPVQNAIQSAIAKWERTPFYFNEVYNESLFSTVAAQEVYTTATSAEILSSANIHRLHIAGSTRYPLIRVTGSQMDDLATTATAAQPTHWSYFNQKIRLYPIPNAIYVIAMSYTQRVAALSLDADTNIWTQDGFDLIKAEAKLILALEVLHDAEMAARMRIAIYGDPADPRSKGYYQALADESDRRGRYDMMRIVDDPPGAIAAKTGAAKR